MPAQIVKTKGDAHNKLSIPEELPNWRALPRFSHYSMLSLESLRPVQGAGILLVEDNEINQQVACALLEQTGFRVDIANRGQEAIDMLEEKVYDCVLMDIQMPVMDGYTATSKLRDDTRFDNLPILAMTANATLEDILLAILEDAESGQINAILKPVKKEIGQYDKEAAADELRVAMDEIKSLVEDSKG